MAERFAPSIGYRVKIKVPDDNHVVFTLIRQKHNVEEGVNRDGIELDHQYIPSTDDVDERLLITATTNGRPLGRAYFINNDGDWEAHDVEINERYRGQGIAKVMYDYAKELLGSFHRSPDQTDAGAGFWDKHKPGQDVWEDTSNKITLTQLYKNQRPDDKERIWDYGRSIWNVEYDVNVMRSEEHTSELQSH